MSKPKFPKSLSTTPVKSMGMKRKDGGWVYYILTIQGDEVIDMWESQPDPKMIIQEAFKIAIVKEFFNQ